MENNYNDDNLENFFRKRLSNYEERPPKGMWDNIQDGMDEKPPQKAMISAWWLLAPLLLLLGSIGYLGYELTSVKEQFQNQQKKLEKLEKENRVIADRYAGIVSQITANEQNNIETPSPPKVVYVEKPATVYRSRTTTPNTYWLLMRGQERLSSPGQFASFRKQKSPSLFKEESTDLLHNPRSVAANYALPKGVVIMQQLNINHSISEEKQRLQKAYPTEEKLEKRFFVELKTDAALTGTGNYYGEAKTFSSDYSSSQLLLQNDQLLQQINYAVRSGYKLNNRWEVGLGFSYGSEVGYSNDKRVFSYTEQGAYTTSDGVFNDYQLPFPNGNSNYSYTILNAKEGDENDIEEGDLFVVTAFSKYRKSYYRIPAFARIYLDQKRLTSFLQGGVSWNIQTQKYVNLRDTQTSFNRLSVVNHLLGGAYWNQSYLSLDIGLGITYKLSPRFRMSADIGGVIPIGFESRSPTSDVYPTVLNTGLGLQYYWGK